MDANEEAVYDAVLCRDTCGMGLDRAVVIAMAGMFPAGADLVLVVIQDEESRETAIGFVNGELYEEALDESLRPLEEAVSGICAETIPDLGNGLYEVSLKSPYCRQSPEVKARILMRYGY